MWIRTLRSRDAPTSAWSQVELVSSRSTTCRGLHVEMDFPRQVAGFTWNQLISLRIYFPLNFTPQKKFKRFQSTATKDLQLVTSLKATGISCMMSNSSGHSSHLSSEMSCLLDFEKIFPQPLSQSRLRAQISSSLKSFETARVGPNRQKFLEPPLQVHSCAFYV